MDALFNKDYKRIVAVWARRCLSGDSHIIMHDGSYKLLRDIKEGDIVLSWDGSGFVPDRVKHHWSTGRKKTVRVTSSYFPTLTTSVDHRFATTILQGERVHWVSALQLHDATLNTLHYPGVKTGVEAEDAAELAAYIRLYGTLHKPFHVELKAPLAIADRVRLLFDHISEKKGEISTGNTLMLFFDQSLKGHSVFISWLKNEASFNQLPLFLWESSEKTIISYLVGMLSKHGYVSIKSDDTEEYGEISFNDLPNWDLYWLCRKIGLIPDKIFNEDESLSFCLSKGCDVKKLVSLRSLFGWEDEQVRLKSLLETCVWKRSKVRGAYAGSCHSIEPGEDEELFDIETENHHNFLANGYLVHNSGKDIVGWNCMIRAALIKPGVYFYCAPTYSHGRKIIWDSMTNDGFKFLDFLPPELIERKNDQQMKVHLINGAMIQIIGSDAYDRSLVGSNPLGIVFTEWALADPRAYQFARPILAANDGWAMFLSTPRAKNHFYELYQIAQHHPEWYATKLTVQDTGHISLAAIEKERASGLMSEDLIQQEYFCSFDLGAEGAYYSKYVDRLRLNGQIGHVPWESAFEVHTAWDLGVRDATSIIFFQTIGQTVRIIDCYENSKEGLEHYVNVIKNKPYTYGKHIAPHDIKVKEWGTGMTRIEKAKHLGIRFTLAPNISIVDGIEAVRSTFNKIWIDERACAQLIKALEAYRQEYDHKRKIYKAQPLHDHTSHFADCMRYLCLSLPKTRQGTTPEELERRYAQALYGHNANMPAVFRDDLPPY